MANNKLISTIELTQSFLKKDTTKEPKKTQTLRRLLKDKYLSLFDENISYAIKNEMLELMWKNCFYFEISFYRKQPEKEEKKKAIKSAMNIYLQMLNKFLIKGGILDEYEDHKDLNKYGLHDGEKEIKEVTLKQDYIIACYSFAIYLGDLERYFQTTKLQKGSFNNAVNYYEKAIKLIPQNGRAYNQIAYISANQNKSIKALYFYVRSFVCKYPFKLTRENIKTFLQTASKRFSKSINESNFTRKNLFILSLDTKNSLQLVLVNFYSILLGFQEEYSGNEISEYSLSVLEMVKSLVIFELKPNSANKADFKLLFEIFIISVFVVHSNTNKRFQILEKKTENDKNRQFSIIWLYDLMTEVIKLIPPSQKSHLILLALFCEYLQSNEEIIKVEDTGMFVSEAKENETRAKKRFWNKFAESLNYLNGKEVFNSPDLFINKKDILISFSEYTELQGLEIFTSTNLVKKLPVKLNEEIENKLRVSRIKSFTRLIIEKYNYIDFDPNKQEYFSYFVETENGKTTEDENSRDEILTLSSESSNEGSDSTKESNSEVSK